MTDAWCELCGAGLEAADHLQCLPRADLEPPRFCPACRRRMTVQITPTGWTARCSEHGTRSGS